jgi:hypothetical protein
MTSGDDSDTERLLDELSWYDVEYAMAGDSKRLVSTPQTEVELTSGEFFCYSLRVEEHTVLNG